MNGLRLRWRDRSNGFDQTESRQGGRNISAIEGELNKAITGFFDRKRTCLIVLKNPWQGDHNITKFRLNFQGVGARCLSREGIEHLLARSDKRILLELPQGERLRGRLTQV